MALDINPEMKGMFITFGRCSLRGTTLIVICGRPSNVTIVVFTLRQVSKLCSRRFNGVGGATYKGGLEINCSRARAVPIAPVTSTHTAVCGTSVAHRLNHRHTTLTEFDPEHPSHANEELHQQTITAKSTTNQANSE